MLSQLDLDPKCQEIKLHKSKANEQKTSHPKKFEQVVPLISVMPASTPTAVKQYVGQHNIRN